jgi:hypothetical protein
MLGVGEERGGDGEAVELPAIVHTSGDQTRLGFLPGGSHPWMRASYMRMTTGPTTQSIEVAPPPPLTRTQEKGSPRLGFGPVRIEI